MRPNRKQPAINVQGWSRTGNEKPNNWNKQENFKTDEQTGRNKSFQWQPKINNIKKFKKNHNKAKKVSFSASRLLNEKRGRGRCEPLKPRKHHSPAGKLPEHTVDGETPAGTRTTVKYRAASSVLKNGRLGLYKQSTVLWRPTSHKAEHKSKSNT
jgi:hypothetical protein